MEEQDHKPTAELIKRASAIADPEERRQVIGEIRELRRRYAGTEAEFKSPNGRPSGLIAALGEEQGRQAWYAIRTPSFKNWFGDWEIEANAEWVFNAKPVKQLEGTEFPKSGKDLVSQVNDFFKSIGGKVEREGLGVVNLTRQGIRTSIAHGIGRTKAVAFTGVPEVIKYGKIIDQQTNWKGRGYDAYVIDAPINIGNVDYIAEVIINKDKDGQRFYLHEVEIKEKARSAFKTGMDTSALQAPAKSAFKTGMNTGALQASKLIITKKLNEVKGNVSKIIDENGEPSPVYRGDKPERETFANPQGINFAGDKTVAAYYSSGGLYNLFLNIKNPLVLNENSFNRAREQIGDMLEEIYEKDWSELAHDSRYQRLKEKYLAFRNEEGSAVRDFYNDFLPEVSEDTPLEDFKEILLKSVHDANAFEWRQIDYHDIDILNPFIQAMGYDGIVRPYDPLGRARGNEFIAFDPAQIKSAERNAGTYNRADPSITDSGSERTISNNINKEKVMQIPISTQAEYDNAVKNRLHMENELVIENTSDFITIHTNATVGKNARCKTDDKSSITVTVKENGILTAEGKTTVIGYDNANIIATNNCKITLHDSAFGNCYEHCHITLKGTSKISADGNCTVHAYDEAAVSASGSSKVYTYQKATAKGTDVSALSGKGESTLTGQKNCSITAKDNCIVYASDNCTVQAADNCLVVANKYATIKAKDNCLIMSNENPNDNITFSDKCEHLKLESVNDKNIMGALKQMAQSKAVVERPYVAIQILKDNIPQTRREAVNRRLNTMGLKDQTAAKNYIYSLIEAEPGIKNQTAAKNLERRLEAARKAGYVQGVCECVAAVGSEQNLGKKLLSEMNVTKDMAKKFASPETYKTLEQGIFAQKQEQKLEQTHSRKL